MTQSSGAERLEPSSDPADWRLRRPLDLRVVAALLVCLPLLSISGRRSGIDRLPALVVESVGSSVGLSRSSEVGPAVRRLASGLFPPVLSEKVDVSRIEGFDPRHLPAFTHLVHEPVRQYDALTNRWRVLDTRDSLYDPIGYLKRSLVLMYQTLEIAVWGTLLALLAALPLAYCGARGYAPHPVVYRIARAWSSFNRATPEMILALLLVMIVGFGALAGILTLAFNTSGFLAKFLADDIENADPGPQEALRCLGANRLKVLRYAVLPQTTPQVLAYLQYTLERNVRAATAIGIVGAGGIGMELKGRWDMYDFGHVSTVLIIMLTTVLCLERVTQVVRTRIIQP